MNYVALALKSCKVIQTRNVTLPAADPGEIEPTPVLTPTMTEMSTVPVTVVTQTVDIVSTPIPELPENDSDYDMEESVTDASKLEEVELEDTCANDTAVVCKNGGICLSTIAGPKCHCPLQGGTLMKRPSTKQP